MDASSSEKEATEWKDVNLDSGEDVGMQDVAEETGTVAEIPNNEEEQSPVQFTSVVPRPSFERCPSPLGKYVYNSSDLEVDGPSEASPKHTFLHTFISNDNDIDHRNNTLTSSILNSESTTNIHTNNQNNNNGFYPTNLQNDGRSDIWFQTNLDNSNSYDSDSYLGPHMEREQDGNVSYHSQGTHCSEDDDIENSSIITSSSGDEVDIYEDAEESFISERPNEGMLMDTNKPPPNIINNEVSHAGRMVFLMLGPEGEHSVSKSHFPPVFTSKKATPLISRARRCDETLVLPPYNKFSRSIKMDALQKEEYIATPILQTATELWMKENALALYYSEETYCGPRGKKREREHLYLQKAVVNRALEAWLAQSQGDDPKNPYSYYYDYYRNGSYDDGYYDQGYGDDSYNNDNSFTYSNPVDMIREGAPEPEGVGQTMILDGKPNIYATGPHGDGIDDEDIILEDDWEDRAFQRERENGDNSCSETTDNSKIGEGI